ncbi:MAG TPA: TetR/AcrR family transcriptional regulator [Candidatus Angelobacter sp.]|jgi:AcrR family transcriptional regulator|nr:TetR/AcrR family transcriptional regulator [Candidatus Angelobacter sp.]
MRPSVEPRLLESAILLFSEHGYAGVNVQDIVVHAETNLTSFKRYFKDKGDAFDKALEAVIARTPDPAELAIVLLQKQHEQDLLSLIQTVVHRWYGSLSPGTARLLMYAYLSNSAKWKRKAHAHIFKMVTVLASAMKAKLSSKSHLDPQLAAQVLIMALWQFKITEAQDKTMKEQTAIVDAMIGQAVRGFVGG